MGASLSRFFALAASGEAGGAQSEERKTGGFRDGTSRDGCGL